jgi:hypothetical protein
MMAATYLIITKTLLAFTKRLLATVKDSSKITPINTELIMYNTSLLYLSSVINLDILISSSYVRQEFLKEYLGN